MAHYPQSAVGLNYITYPAGPGANGSTLTAHASANTKGAYVEYVSSSPFACNNLIVTISFANVTGRRYLLDVATGGAGVETVIIPNLLFEGPGAGAGQAVQGIVRLPCAIPAGTRIAARIQCSTGSSIASVSIAIAATGDTPSPSTYLNYGSNTVDSGGATVDPGGSIDTKGAYTEVTASTSAVIQTLTILFGYGGNTGPAAAGWAVDIATGGVGVETVLIPDLRISGHTSLAPSPWSYTFLTYIPAGTRIAVRASCSTADATDRLIDVAIVASAAPAEVGGGALSWAPLSVVVGAGMQLVRAVASGGGVGRN